MELLKKITPEEISPTLHIGREDSPELGTEGMQQLFDAHPNINSANANYNVEIQNRNNTAVQAHMDNTKNPHSVTKAQVGLGNVDNTTDLNKPVSIAQQNTLNTKADKVNTYTKAEVDTKLATKANTIDVNTKLATKADISYTDQKDADTLVSAKAYADQKVVDIGTGDMAMAVYDPWGRKGNVFEHIEDISIHTSSAEKEKTAIDIASKVTARTQVITTWEELLKAPSGYYTITPDVNNMPMEAYWACHVVSDGRDTSGAYSRNFMIFMAGTNDPLMLRPWVKSIVNSEEFSWFQLVTDLPPQEFAVPFENGFSPYTPSIFWKNSFSEVSLIIRFVSNMVIHAGQTVAVLPNGFRPKSIVSTVCQIKTLSSISYGYIDIGNDGIIKIYPEILINQNIVDCIVASITFNV